MNFFLRHTHTRLTALCPGLPGWSGTRKAKPIWILLKQETLSGNGISWAICKSAPCSRQITTPAPHRSVFLQAGCPSCHPTNSVKALKAQRHSYINFSTCYRAIMHYKLKYYYAANGRDETSRTGRWRLKARGCWPGNGQDRKCCMVVVSAEHIVTACVQYSE